MNHELKVWPCFYEALERGEKPFEMRSEEDRTFSVGDTLTLQRFEPCPVCNGSGMDGGTPCRCSLTNMPRGRYTGEFCRRSVTYILRGPAFGLQKGWVIMGLKP